MLLNIFKFFDPFHINEKQVADLTLLRAETHKFESYYLDNLVGQYGILCI